MIANSEIPFATDQAHKTLPHMLAVMICFVSLLCAFSGDIYHYIQQQTAEQSRYIYIEMPVMEELSEAKRTAVTQHVFEDASLENVQWLEQEEVERLLTPWLGKGLPLDTLPLPKLGEVRVSQPDMFDAAALRSALHAIDSKIQLDAEQPWRGQFAQGGYVMVRVMLAAAFALFLVTLSLMTLMARTHFQLHGNVLELLRRVGAKDAYIVKQFQRHNARTALKGALFGSLTGAGLYVFWYVVGLNSMIGIGGDAIGAMAVRNWLLSMASFCLLPAAMVGATLLVTKISVNRQLREAY